MGVGAHLEHLNLSLSVKLKVAVSLESTLDEFSELGGERRVIQVVYPQTRSRGLGGVGWSDTPLGSTNRRTTQLNLLEAVDDLMEAKDEMSSVRDLESVGTFESWSI